MSLINEDIRKKACKFRDDRNWGKFHTGKDLAISLQLEASELLEVYQWSGTDLECVEKIDKIKEELADVFLYSILIADKYKLDIDQIINDKIMLNEKHYPVDKAKGKSDKYTNYQKIK